MAEQIEKTCSWYDVPCGMEYLTTELEYLFLDGFDSILNGLASIYEAIPVPDFVARMGSYQLPDFMLYITDVFQIYAGLGIVMGSYLVRFLIRRIPIIG